MLSRLLAAEVHLGNISGPPSALGNVALYDPALGWQPALRLFERIISNLIGALTIISALWFIYQIILGALAWISSGGDKQSLQTAQKRITQSFLGLLVVVLSYMVIGLIGHFVGIDIFNVFFLINNIAPT